ncbi:MAG: sporulation protein YqfD [Clostridia bacterium]|nr:sporulation protein YqfD [Clostridia bacterium]
MNLALLLGGSVTLRTDAENRTHVLNICLSEGMPYVDLSWETDGGIHFRCPLSTARRLMRICRARGIFIERVSADGIPEMILRLRRRWGLIAGMLCAIAMVVLSGMFVWDVRITGNETLREDEIKTLLSECGFGVGSYLPDVRTGALENRVLIASDRLSWISVNLDGTVARVQVIERRAADSDASSARPANLVAACDGQIELIQLYRGDAAVVIGQAVKKGELLASGLRESELTGLHITRAAGEVLARTEHEICVEIPLAYEEKCLEKEKIVSATLKFFNFSLKIFENTGNTGELYDIIEKEIDPPAFGARPLPLSLSLQVAATYTAEPRTRTHEEALALAYDALDERLSELLSDAQILAKAVTTEMTDASVRLRATVTCIEDIALVQEFEVG